MLRKSNRITRDRLRPEGITTAITTTSTTTTIIIIIIIIIIKTADLTKLSPNMRLCTLEIIHTHIPWIGLCVMKTIRCATSQIHKYEKLQRKIQQTFYRNSIIDSSRQQRECVCRYFLKAALNFALSFVRIVTLCSKVVKIFMPSYNVLFWKQDRLAFGLWRWCLCLVWILCIDEFVWKISWLLIMKLIN